MKMDPIQIEIVGGDVWQNALPIAAILLSVASLLLTVFWRFRDGGKLRVRVSLHKDTVAVHDGSMPGKTVPMVKVSATNVGRAGSIMVEDIGFTGRRKKNVVTATSQVSRKLNSTFPASLGPGESASKYFEFRQASMLHDMLQDEDRGMLAIAQNHNRDCRKKLPKKLFELISNRNHEDPILVEPGIVIMPSDEIEQEK